MLLRLFVLLVGLVPLLAVADSRLTAETEELRVWLSSRVNRPALGGQWNGGTTSIGWLEQAAVAGREPMMYGIEYYDYGPIERRLDAREAGRAYIIDRFRRGGLVTLVDHMPNFVTRGDSWDRQGDTLSAILPGGAAHSEFVAYLDRLAAFLKNLDVDGRRVPVLFRPFHEMNGGWFWWGDPADGHRLIAIWRFAHEYLQARKGIRNVLWVWSPNIERNPSADRYMQYWPGADYVDVVGLDGYDNSQDPDPASQAFVGSFAAVSAIANNASLPVAMTEIGFEYGSRQIAGFWTSRFMPALSGYLGGARYILVWNGKWGPAVGTPAAPSFKELIDSGALLMDGGVTGREIYGNSFLRVE